jgi:hypothetical protein
MYTYTTTVHVDEKRRVLIDLPDDVPVGEVQIKVEVVNTDSTSVRDTLRAAGLLAEAPLTDEEVILAEELSEAEELELGLRMAGPRPVEDYISEDREEASNDLQREYRMRLIAAGHLSNARTSPEAIEVSAMERSRLAGVLNGKLSLSQAILDDRDEDS